MPKGKVRPTACAICGRAGFTCAPAGEPTGCVSCRLFGGLDAALGRYIEAEKRWTEVCDLPGAHLRGGPETKEARG